MTERLHDWVLILDDDPWAAEIARTMLEQNGIPVHTTDRLEAALEAIKRMGPPPVMLLDAVMPGQDGFEVCRRLRKEGALRHTRVVFVTSLTDEASRLAALEAGADDFLSKPLSESILISRVRSLIELSRLRDRDQARLQYETVLDTIGEGVVSLDDADFLVEANQAARTLLGLPADTSDPVHLPTFLAEQWSVERGRISRSSRARLVRNGRQVGATAALEWISRELPGTTEAFASWTAVIRDATDTFESDQAMGRLVRTLSHKLRTPLTGISTALELVDESDSLDDDTRMLLDIAQESAERLRTTLVRILEYTQATSEVTPRYEILDRDGLRSQLELDESVRINVDLTRPVVTDVVQAKSNVEELLQNARAAGASDYELTVGAHPDGAVTFSLTDDGVGLPVGTAERIFEPLYQVDRSGEAHGTGMGLAIVAARVEGAGGSVGAHSSTDGRTSVWFTLPYRFE